MTKSCQHQCEFCFIDYSDVMSSENVFRDIKEEEINTIIKSVHHRVRSFEKGEVLITEGEAYNSLIVLLQGLVTTDMMNSEGQTLIIEQLQAPATLAPSALFSTENKIPVSVHAVTKCKVLILPRDSIKTIFAQNPIVLTNFMRILSNRVHFLSDKMKMLQFQNLRSKVSLYFIQQHRLQKSTNIYLPKTQQELADIFGVARPSLTRIIKELDKEGIIYSQGKNIVIKDMQKLIQSTK